MSRIGRQLVKIPAGVEVALAGQTLTAKGPKGTLSLSLHPCVVAKRETQEGADVLTFTVAHPDDPKERAQWGTAAANAVNLLEGVAKGFEKKLEIEGVGYRVSASGQGLKLGVGFSHDVDFALPAGVTAKVEKNTVTLQGADKQQVGEVAARIRKIRKPEPYKGKGIHYVGEHIRRKAGKAAKAAAE